MAGSWRDAAGTVELESSSGVRCGDKMGSEAGNHVTNFQIRAAANVVSAFLTDMRRCTGELPTIVLYNFDVCCVKSFVVWLHNALKRLQCVTGDGTVEYSDSCTATAKLILVAVEEAQKQSLLLDPWLVHLIESKAAAMGLHVHLDVEVNTVGEFIATANSPESTIFVASYTSASSELIANKCSVVVTMPSDPCDPPTHACTVEFTPLLSTNLPLTRLVAAYSGSLTFTLTDYNCLLRVLSPHSSERLARNDVNHTSLPTVSPSAVKTHDTSSSAALPGVWSVEARGELSLALLRLGGCGADVLQTVSRVIVSPTDGRWGSAPLSSDMRWDLCMLMLLGVQCTLGTVLPIDTGPESKSDSVIVPFVNSGDIGGSMLWNTNTVTSSTFQFLQSLIAKGDIPIPKAIMGGFPVLSPHSPVVTSALRCIGAMAMGMAFPSLSSLCFHALFNSPSAMAVKSDTEASRLLGFEVGSVAPPCHVTAGEWLVLARCCEQCNNLPLAIHAYEKAVRLLDNSDLIQLRIRHLKSALEAMASKSSLPEDKPVPTSSATTSHSNTDGKSSKPGCAMLECDVKLSQSVLWKLQSWFYDSVGASAWGECGPVPFDITSNSYIARQYAAVALSLLPDVTPCSPTDTRPHTLLVVELGAGHGKFGYLFLLELQRLFNCWRATHHPSDGIATVTSPWPRVKYVMTDFTQSNVDVLVAHPCLAPLVEAGVLDFAVFDACTSTSLKLVVSGTELVTGAAARMMVVSNYFVDTLPADAYRVINGELHEGFVTTIAVPSKDNKVATGVRALSPGQQLSDDELKRLQTADAKSPLLHQAKASFSWKPVPCGDASVLPLAPSLDDTALTTGVLSDMRLMLATANVNRTFLHHAMPLRCFEQLRRIWSGDSTQDGEAFVVMITDKGCPDMFTVITDEDNAGDPYLAKHGSISVSVSFPTLSLAFRRFHRNGFSVVPEPAPRHNSICTCVVGIASPVIRRGLSVATWDCMTGLTPDAFYSLIDRIGAVSARINCLQSRDNTSSASKTAFRAVRTSLSLSACLAIVRLSCFDPGTFLALSGTIHRRIQDNPTPLSKPIEDELMEVINNVVTRHYVVNPSDASDSLVECARLLFLMKCKDSHLMALSFLDRCQSTREGLHRAFQNAYTRQSSSSAPTSSSRFGSKGTSAPMVKAFFVKAFVLKDMGRTQEALALMEQCAAIHSKYRPVLQSWQPTTATVPSNTTTATVVHADAVLLAQMRAIQSKRLYYRRRLEECTQAVLDDSADSATGLEHALEVKLIVSELEKLNAEFDALQARQQGKA